MKYLMMIKHAETTTPQDVPQALMEAMGEFVQKGFSSGVLKDTAGLKPTSAGYRIRSSGACSWDWPWAGPLPASTTPGGASARGHTTTRS